MQFDRSRIFRTHFPSPNVCVHRRHDGPVETIPAIWEEANKLAGLYGVFKPTIKEEPERWKFGLESWTWLANQKRVKFLSQRREDNFTGVMHFDFVLQIIATNNLIKNETNLKQNFNQLP